MHHAELLHQAPHSLERFDDVFVGIEHQNAFVLWHLTCEPTVQVERERQLTTLDNDIVFFAHSVIVNTKCRCLREEGREGKGEVRMRKWR